MLFRALQMLCHDLRGQRGHRRLSKSTGRDSGRKWEGRKERRQATLANRLPCLYLSRFMRKGASEAREYMTRYRFLQVFLQLSAIAEPVNSLSLSLWERITIVNSPGASCRIQSRYESRRDFVLQPRVGVFQPTLRSKNQIRLWDRLGVRA
jgi:hypothetical protein